VGRDPVKAPDLEPRFPDGARNRNPGLETMDMATKKKAAKKTTKKKKKAAKK
jgi:hypothetical protein